MFGLKDISKWQFALFRILLAVYLCLHFGHLLPYAGELFSSEGTLGDPSLSPLYKILPSPFWISDSAAMATGSIIVALLASGALLLGWHRRIAAAILLYIWAYVFCRNPLIANPSLAYIGLILVLSLLIPTEEPLQTGKKSSAQKWFYPSGVYWTAWLLLAIGYTFSGLIKLGSPSWVDGSAMTHLANNPLARPWIFRDLLLNTPEVISKLLTWASLAAEILFLPLSIWRRGRLIAWASMLGMHLGILLVVDFADLTAAMVLIHLFVFDPYWLPSKTNNKLSILFYDGECGLCTNTVKFLMEEDRAGVIKYAPLQGDTSREYLPESLREVEDLRTVVYLHTDSHGKQMQLLRSNAIAQALKDIGGFWRTLSWLLLCIPSPLRELAYRFIAKHRLKIFPSGACALPTESQRARLLP